MTEHELDTLLRDYGGTVRAVCRATRRTPRRPRPTHFTSCGAARGCLRTRRTGGGWSF